MTGGVRERAAGLAVGALRRQTGDLRQLAAVRHIRLEGGSEHGQRGLAFSTGGGLDFWVLPDRGMDIGPLWFRGTPVSWEHPNGYVAPGLHNADGDHGTGFERILSGFVVTCGLEHARQPSAGHPLHGRFPLTPARLTAHGEDWDAPTPFLYAEGTTTSAHLSGPSFRLYRRIEAPVAGRTLRVIDEVENIGTGSQELKLLHHINFGFPAVSEGTTASLNGEPVVLASECNDAHDPQCESVGERARAVTELTCPPADPWPGMTVTIASEARAQPFVQFWADRRDRRNIISVEPSTCARAADGTSLDGPVLQPGERWSGELAIAFADLANAATIA